ncbi:hypothetical protein V4C53_18015 [Paraburkholderia azotifigens]|uniref:hypothetical protein n=1 Tax=Paraburkholderia azotifigens TaxID=2057004 RepID=UPI003178A1A4
MSEFNNRVAAQRDILRVVNRQKWDEELFGLASGAIDRWRNANQLNEGSELLILVRRAADKLFFLANKSQEQITEEYRLLSSEVSSLIEQIGRAALTCKSPA